MPYHNIGRLTTGDTGGKDGLSVLAVLATKVRTLVALTRLQVESSRDLGGQDIGVKTTVDGSR